VFETVPVAEELILTVIENVAEALGANVTSEQVIVPVPPTEGVVQEKSGPVDCDSETKVVFAGMVSVSETFAAFDGPPFVNVRL
jgi:hypothetical protein